MEKFSEFFGKSEKSQKSDRSFFYMLYPDQKSIEKLMVLQDKIKNQYPTCGVPVKPTELHCTVRGVDIGIGQEPDSFIDWIEEAYLPEFVAFVGNLDILGDYLVVKLNSDDLNNWYSKINALMDGFGYKEDSWRIYRPHISLFEKPNIADLQPFTTYKFRINLNTHKISNDEQKIIFSKTSIVN